MTITKLILYKNNRLSLLGRDKFTLLPNKYMTILIGIGGVGKSTILAELSPIPADLKEYGDNGYKIIHITHNAHTYILESKDNKHNFILNTNNLNKSGTRKQQLILVKEHFNITPHLLEVLLGVNTFTNMSINERKRWFLEASNIDLTYPLKVYNKLRERASDLKSNIKLLNSKLINEKTNRLSDKEFSKYKRDVSMCNKYIEELLISKQIHNHRDVLNINPNTLLSGLEYSISKLSKRHTLSNIDIRINTVQTNVDAIKSNLSKLHQELKEIMSVEEIIKDGDLSHFKHVLSTTNDEINRIQSLIYLDIPFKHLETTYTLLKEVYPTLSIALDEITPNSIDSETYTTYKNRVTILSLNRDKYVKERDKLVQRDLHLEDSKKHIVKCDNCNSDVHIDYDVKEHVKVKHRLSEVINKLKHIESEYKELTGAIDIYLINKNKIEYIKNISKRPYLDIPISYLFKEHNVHDYKGNILDTLYKVITNIKDWIPIVSLLENKENYTNKINILNNNLTVNIKNKDSVKDKLFKETNIIHSLNQELDILNKDKKLLEEISTLYTKYNTYLTTVNSIHKGKLQEFKNTYINTQINTVKRYLVDIEIKINDSKYIDTNISKLQSEITEYTDRLKSVNTLISKLSPTDGIIAKYLNITLNRFISEINLFISKIWSYELKVLPCSLDKHGLTYRFPVSVNGDIPRKDVIKCSSSQQEIINLGFKLTIMKHLNMGEYPLYLDEFGRSFDITHLEEAYRSIDHLIDDESLGQILLISHFQHVYNRFPHAKLVTLVNK